MAEDSKKQGFSRKQWATVGIFLMVVLIGAGGCGTSTAASAPASQAQSNQGQPNQGQQGQGQRVRNPSLQAAREIQLLQSDQQNALTSDQKDRIKPILQELISTSNPSQDVLQQKADAINAVLTEQQKSSLAKQRPFYGNNQNANNSNGNSTKRSNPQGGGGTDGRQAGSPPNPQVMYQQALDSLK